VRRFRAKRSLAARSAGASERFAHPWGRLAPDRPQSERRVLSGRPGRLGLCRGKGGIQPRPGDHEVKNTDRTPHPHEADIVGRLTRNISCQSTPTDHASPTGAFYRTRSAAPVEPSEWRRARARRHWRPPTPSLTPSPCAGRPLRPSDNRTPHPVRPAAVGRHVSAYRPLDTPPHPAGRSGASRVRQSDGSSPREARARLNHDTTSSALC
jgi:hypothetical protein